MLACVDLIVLAKVLESGCIVYLLNSFRGILLHINPTQSQR